MFKGIFSHASEQVIKKQRVDLGTGVFTLPIADLRGQDPGKTLLVTAGMDGDEYTGIASAYQLIKKYQSGNFTGRLIVLPIVNIPGFEAECSRNPLDEKYPKAVFPGNARGSSTERLVNWLLHTYLSHADVWYDLHSGALSERLNPFLWTYKTGVTHVDQWMESFHKQSQADWIVYQSAPFLSKYRSLANNGCAYIMAESGERGYQKTEDIARHLQWIEAAMSSLDMIESQRDQRSSSPTIFHDVSFVLAPCDGLWSPRELSRAEVASQEILGTYRRLDEIESHELRAPSDGFPLWWKETMRMQKGEILCGLARP